MTRGPHGRSPSGSRWSEWSRILLVVGATLALIVAIAYDTFLVWWMFRHHMNDFGKFYWSTRQYLGGGDLYATNPATLIEVAEGEWRQFTNMNPPHFHLLLVPLALLPPAVALASWMLGGLASCLLSGWLVVREVRLSTRVAGPAVLAGVYLTAWAGTGSLLLTGQLSWLLLLPLTLMWSAVRRERWSLAGVIVGILASIKSFLLVPMAYFLIRRRWRALAASLTAFTAAFAVGLVVFGAAAHRSWLASLGGMNWPWPVLNGSLLGFLARTLGPSPSLAPVLLAPDLIYPVWALLALTGLGITLVAVARRPTDADRSLALLLTASLLFSPLGWVYYAWFLIPPLVALSRNGLPERVRWLILFSLAAGLCPSPLARSAQPSALATATLGSVYFWGLAATWVALLKWNRGARQVADPVVRP